MKKFREEVEVAGLLEEEAFQPSSASLSDHIQNGHGDLVEGIRTTMKIGDWELFGAPEDWPEESSVEADYLYFYDGKTMAPMASLLPTITVCVYDAGR